MPEDDNYTILLLESYYGGSHALFLRGLQDHLDFSFVLLTLPPRKWKMRMQLAAPWMAEQTLELIRAGRKIDCILCSSLLDVATFRVLLCNAGLDLPVGVYFHENQFAYPNQTSDPQSYQFAAINFTSALAADQIAFNSMYNRDTFLDGVAQYLNKAADMDIVHLVDSLRRKSTVLYPGMDYDGMDRDSSAASGSVPVIVWNHRWEHDKGPEAFFHALYELAGEGIDFRLIVLGQSFVQHPAVFEAARKNLEGYIDHFGFAPERQAYINLLGRGTIAVSTAKHEFFGIAMLEAVRCGCLPLVPDCLAYRELFPEKYRYGEGEFAESLKRALAQPDRSGPDERISLTDHYAWDRMADAYTEWFLRMIGGVRCFRTNGS